MLGATRSSHADGLRWRRATHQREAGQPVFVEFESEKALYGILPLGEEAPVARCQYGILVLGTNGWIGEEPHEADQRIRGELGLIWILPDRVMKFQEPGPNATPRRRQLGEESRQQGIRCRT